MRCDRHSEGHHARQSFLSSNTQDFIEVADITGMFQTFPNIFLSSNTQDFIEVGVRPRTWATHRPFLSSNTQDFIEVRMRRSFVGSGRRFLSSNTQDFIEVNIAH